jgi:hypothetical protein
MRLPEFTGEASLYSASGKYTGFSARAKRPGTGSVTAEFDYSTLGAGYWERLAAGLGACHPPCWYDMFNDKCHCQLDALSVGGPNLHQGLTA